MVTLLESGASSGTGAGRVEIRDKAWAAGLQVKEDGAETGAWAPSG